MSGGLREALDRLGIGDLHDVFAAHDLEAAAIHDLTEADLRELGLSIGQRKRFLRARSGGAANGGAAPRPAPDAHDPPAQAERRQLTTLFCDLVGSTQLSNILDPEDLREVIEAYQALCGDVLRSHGGHLAYAQGDGIMCYFGFPVAQEDDPERAVRAAAEICERLRGLKTATPEPLAVRIGIATGVVVVGESRDPSLGEGMVVGQTPNLAARLQTLAGPGEVMVADSTRRLCGALFEYEARGATELKGFPEPVPVYRVIGESRVESRFEARASTGLTPMVGRAAELERLADAWRRARGGTGQLVMVRGEPGMGKSRLARAFIEGARADNPRLLRWYCASHLANRALHPLIRELEAAAGIVRTLPAAARQQALEKVVAEARSLGAEDVPFLADLLGIETDIRDRFDIATRARRTQAALLRRVEGLAQDAPVLILLEDAHWADAATLDLLATLIGQVASSPVMLLVTHRPEFVAPWQMPAHSAEIALDPLDATSGARLLGMVVRERQLPATVVRTILEKAGGVPLFVEELTKTVLDAVVGQAHTEEGLASLTIPATLQDSLMARLDGLGQAKELAQIGSVIGREFTAEMVRAVAPDQHDVEGGLRRLCASGLASEVSRQGIPSIAFHHALVQDTAYESLLRKRRREIHHAVAERMLAGVPAFAGTEPEVIARHCSRGGLPAEAVKYWLEAGLQALDRAANLSALGHLRAALKHLDELPSSAETLGTELAVQMALAPACMAIHGWAAPEVADACRRANALAVRLNDATGMVGSAWGLWTNYFLRGEMDAALETARSVDAMAAGAGGGPLRVAADHAVGFTLYFRGDLGPALARAEAGIARFDVEVERQIVRMFQFSSTTALHGFAAASLWMMGREAEAETALKQSLALPERLGHAPSLAFALAFTQYTLMYQQDWPRVRETAERLLAVSQEEGFRLWIPQASTFIGLCEAAEGKLEAGLAKALDGFDGYAATGTGLTLSQLLPSLGECLIRAGRAEEAVRRLDAMIDSASRRHEAAYLSELYRVRGLAHDALGGHGQAAADVAAARDLARAQGALALLRRAEDAFHALGTRGRTFAAAWMPTDMVPRRGQA